MTEKEKNNFSDHKLQKSLDVQAMLTVKGSYNAFEDTMAICKDVLIKKQRLRYTFLVSVLNRMFLKYYLIFSRLTVKRRFQGGGKLNFSEEFLE